MELVLPRCEKQKPLVSLHRQKLGVLRICSQACIRHTQPPISLLWGLWLLSAQAVPPSQPLAAGEGSGREEYVEGEAM